MSLRSLLLISCLVSPLALAEELVVPVGQQGADKTSLERPSKGLTAQAVETKFGAPLQKSAAVGQPPISQWEYPEYRVFFESDRVLHTVLKPMPTEPDITPAAAAAPTPTVEAETPAPEAPAPAAADPVTAY